MTQKQKIILDLFKSSDFLSGFYFTGGTALSAYYLQHRYSDDLDFFSTNEFDSLGLFQEVQNWADKAKFNFTSRNIVDTYIFEFIFQDGEKLKVDFAKYPYVPLESKVSINGLSVSSQLDIAVNKTLVISQRTDVKDFVDLFFLLQTYSMYDLHEMSNRKFRRDYDLMLLAADLTKVTFFDALPRMIKPLTLEELKNIFIDLAKNLGLTVTTE